MAMSNHALATTFPGAFGPESAAGQESATADGRSWAPTADFEDERASTVAASAARSAARPPSRSAAVPEAAPASLMGTQFFAAEVADFAAAAAAIGEPAEVQLLDAPPLTTLPAPAPAASGAATASVVDVVDSSAASDFSDVLGARETVAAVADRALTALEAEGALLAAAGAAGAGEEAAETFASDVQLFDALGAAPAGRAGSRAGSVVSEATVLPSGAEGSGGLSECADSEIGELVAQVTGLREAFSPEAYVPGTAAYYRVHLLRTCPASFFRRLQLGELYAPEDSLAPVFEAGAATPTHSEAETRLFASAPASEAGGYSASEVAEFAMQVCGLDQEAAEPLPREPRRKASGITPSEVAEFATQVSGLRPLTALSDASAVQSARSSEAYEVEAEGYAEDFFAAFALASAMEEPEPVDLLAGSRLGALPTKAGPAEDCVELRFGLPFGGTDHAAFEAALFDGLRGIGVDVATTSQLRVALREGSIIAQV